MDVGTSEVLFAGSPGVGLDLNVEGTWTTLAPRLGIAYRAAENTVVRMGYGRGYDVGIFGSVFGHNVTQNLPVLGIQSMQPARNFDAVFSLSQGPPALDPATILNRQPMGPNGRPMLPNGVTAFILPKKLRLPTNDAWNLSIQHQLQKDLAVEAAYIGNKGTHVFAGFGGDYDFNQATIEGLLAGRSVMFTHATVNGRAQSRAWVRVATFAMPGQRTRRRKGQNSPAGRQHARDVSRRLSSRVSENPRA